VVTALSVQLSYSRPVLKIQRVCGSALPEDFFFLVDLMQRGTFWWEQGDDVSEVAENEVILVLVYFSVPGLGASFCMHC